MSLSDAIDAVVAETPLVEQLRKEEVIKRLIEAFKQVPWVTNLDPEALTDELTELATSVSFSTKEFPLHGTGGIAKAKTARMQLQSTRERVMAISQKLRETKLMTHRVMRVGQVYIRQLDAVDGTGKHMDDLCAVALREIVEHFETLTALIVDTKETLKVVDEKSKTLDAWFVLHKQYVFMTGASRGPYGEQETHDRASKGKSLGRRR
jgi:hypothetical protein